MLNEININDVIALAKKAGDAIMKIYSQDFTAEYKADNSPLTQADKIANDIIAQGLGELSKGIPILSEEGMITPYKVRKKWRYFWLVDPLDGTKEFIKKNGEFTVNIALIDKNVPIMGVVYGADELFAGYDKYKNFFNATSDNLSEVDFQSAYLRNISLFNEDSREELLSYGFKNKLKGIDVSNITELLFQKSNKFDRINQALYIDTMLLLPGNNLVKPDRMGMAVSIENRAPFLDYRMLSLAFSMPGKLKLKDGETKYLYKKAVTPLIGKELAYRKKQMFTVPVGEWFKTDLASMCEDLLLSKRTQARGLFNYDYVKKILRNHQDNVENNTREIRALMALEIWFREFF